MPQSTATKLELLLNPKSIAIVGASRDKTKIGHITVRNLLDYQYKGNLYPINPKASKILGLKCYPNTADLPEVPELAIICLPAALVLATLEAVAKTGIKNYVVYSAGFKEIGEDGKQLEKQLADLASKLKLNIIGPNCIGYVNTAHDINATFGKAPNFKGPLKFISQSGAIATSMFDWANLNLVGFDQFITLGNKTVLNENDILEEWLLNKHTNPIGMYLESISDGKKFLDLVAKITPKAPVFVLKPGKSKHAQSAMQSHTGAIAGEDYVIDTAFEQYGIIRCHGLEDMFDLAKAFSWAKAPKGPNVAIISNAGGPAVISADLVEEYGLTLNPMSTKTKNLLQTSLPREASLLNPIDVLGDAMANRYEIAINAVLEEQDVDTILIILTPQMMTEIELTAKLISDLAVKHNKLIVCSFIGGALVEKGQRILNNHKIPAFEFPERAIKVISNMWKWQKYSLAHQKKRTYLFKTAQVLPTENITEIQKIIKNAIKMGRPTLNIMEGNLVMENLNLDVPDYKFVESEKDLIAFARKSQYPFVLKISSSKLLHKKDVKGVVLNILTEQELINAYKTMLETIYTLDEDIKKDAKVLIQKQIVDRGVETIIGVKNDSNFGDVMMFGAGGTFTELISDRNLKILTHVECESCEFEDLIMSSKIYKIITGYRGDKPLHVTSALDVMVKLNYLMKEVEGIKEIECNPMILTEKNAWMVDPKILLY